MQKIKTIFDEQAEALAGISLPAILVASNANSHRCPLVIGVEIEEIDSADGVEVGFNTYYKAQLTVEKDVVLSIGDILLDGKPRIRHHCCAIAPQLRIVLAIIQKVDVVRLDRP